MKPTILVTRPEPDNQHTAKRLQTLGLNPVLMPLLFFKTLATKLPNIHGLSAIAISSSNALRALYELELLEKLVHLPLFAVGETTADMAKSAGFKTITTANNSLDSLGETIAKAQPDGPVLSISAKHRSGDLGARLAPHAVTVVNITTYEMEALTRFSGQQMELLNSGEIDAVSFYSARTAKTFISLCHESGIENVKHLTALCLSSQIEQPLLLAGYQNTRVASAPNEQAMMALALSFAQTERK